MRRAVCSQDYSSRQHQTLRRLCDPACCNCELINKVTDKSGHPRRTPSVQLGRLYYTCHWGRSGLAAGLGLRRPAKAVTCLGSRHPCTRCGCPSMRLLFPHPWHGIASGNARQPGRALRPDFRCACCHGGEALCKKASGTGGYTTVITPEGQAGSATAGSQEAVWESAPSHTQCNVLFAQAGQAMQCRSQPCLTASQGGRHAGTRLLRTRPPALRSEQAATRLTAAPAGQPRQQPSRPSRRLWVGPSLAAALPRQPRPLPPCRWSQTLNPAQLQQHTVIQAASLAPSATSGSTVSARHSTAATPIRQRSAALQGRTWRVPAPGDVDGLRLGFIAGPAPRLPLGEADEARQLVALVPDLHQMAGLATRPFCLSARLTHAA